MNGLRLIRLSLNILQKIYSIVLVKIFPAKIIATVLGIGYLPEWQGHWASLFALLLSVLIAYIFTGFAGSIIDFSMPILIASIIVFVLGLISIYIYHLKDSSLDDEIMINVVFGQLLVCGLSAPAVISIGTDIVLFNNFICEKFLYCAPWFYGFITYVPLFLIPYCFYRFFDLFKPWPASILDRDYNTALSNMCDSLVNALYTLITLYLIAFIVFSLTVDEAMIFFQGITKTLEDTNVTEVLK